MLSGLYHLIPTADFVLKMTINVLCILPHQNTRNLKKFCQHWRRLVLRDTSRFQTRQNDTSHDDVIKWSHFPWYWPFVRGIPRSPVNSPHKDQWRGALVFSLVCAWINGWVNTGEAGHWRRHGAHYDVIVMYTVTSHERWVISNHSIAHSTFFLTYKKENIKSTYHSVFVQGIHRWPVPGFPVTQGPVIRKVLSYHDVLMDITPLHLFSIAHNTRKRTERLNI